MEQEIYEGEVTTNLIVSPIDTSAPGSYRERKLMTSLMYQLQTAEGKNDVTAMLRFRMDLDKLIEARCSTNDGSSVEDALDQLSADEFDQLFYALVGGSAAPIPPENESDSTTGQTETESLPNGSQLLPLQKHGADRPGRLKSKRRRSG